jgi:WD40 repeat protein
MEHLRSARPHPGAVTGGKDDSRKGLAQIGLEKYTGGGRNRPPEDALAVHMKRVAIAVLMLLATAGCATSTVATVPTPTPSPPPSPQPSPQPSPPATSPSPASAGGTVSPSPNPPPPATVACKSGSTASSLFLMGSSLPTQLLYDVSDPIHPRLLCTITNTSAHLFTGDTFVYLKPVSATETDIVLHSLGSGNESVSGKLPLDATQGSWTPDGNLMAYMAPIEPNSSGFEVQPVWLYSQQKSTLLYTYPLGIGDCICRFGLPPIVLAISPDGEYLAVGRLAGKGSAPIAVIRLADGKQVLTASQDVADALWAKTGHHLFLFKLGGPTAESWTPEAGVVELNAISLSILPGLSPDGSQLAYTEDSDGTPPNQPPRVYVYTLATGGVRMLVDQPRTQALFVKDGWVWYLEEGPCVTDCAGSTAPTGKVFAMNLSTGAEQTVVFASGEAPLSQPDAFWPIFQPGEFWPNS